MKSGVTLIELLLAIAIFSLLAAATTPFLSRFIKATAYHTTVDVVQSAVRKAQTYAMQGKGNSTWGICMQGNTIKVFSNVCPVSGGNDTYSIPNGVLVTGIVETTFSRRGEPTTPLTIVVSSGSESTSILINRAGGMTW